MRQRRTLDDLSLLIPILDQYFADEINAERPGSVETKTSAGTTSTET